MVGIKFTDSTGILSILLYSGLNVVAIVFREGLGGGGDEVRRERGFVAGGVCRGAKQSSVPFQPSH